MPNIIFYGDSVKSPPLGLRILGSNESFFLKMEVFHMSYLRRIL